MRRVMALWLLAVLAVAGATAWLGTFPPFLTVMSGSMRPKFNPGDITVMQSLRGHAPRPGEIVQISVPDEYQARFSYPSRVVHRVVKVEDGFVFTKGDNVGNPDPFKTPVGAVNRRVVFVIPSAGRITTFLRSPFGLLWLVGGGVIFLLLPMRDSADERRREAQRNNATLDQLVFAVAEYGKHLESHTAVLKGMSEASQSLASVVAQLEERLEAVELHPRQPQPSVAAQVNRSRWWSRFPRRNTM